jgi:hypothetical protein
MKKTFKISESFLTFTRKLAGKKIVVTCDRSKFVSNSVTVRSVAVLSYEYDEIDVTYDDAYVMPASCIYLCNNNANNNTSSAFSIPQVVSSQLPSSFSLLEVQYHEDFSCIIMHHLQCSFCRCILLNDGQQLVETVIITIDAK